MDALTIIFDNRPLFITVVFLLGMVVGSFLNVVIYRLPIMLENSWRKECEDFLDLFPAQAKARPRYDLIFPASQCPHCQHPIKFYENIPVISYLFLAGKCSACKALISYSYPLIEILSGIFAVIVAWKFGPSWQTFFGLGFTWCLVCLTVIDLDRQLLPDAITLPFLWLGLLVSLFTVFTDSHSSIVGAVAGYLSLWTVYQLFKVATGKEGMGYGDFKLLAALGAWLGWQYLLLIVLVSSMVGAVFGIFTIMLLKKDRTVPIPFGPFLAAAGWITMVWGDEILTAYLGPSGLH